MASQYILPAIYESILLACVYEHAGNIDGAATALKQAIVLAQPDHLVMPFAEHAEYLPQTMKRLCSDAAAVSFIEQAQGLSLAEPLSTLRTALAKPSLPLSKREQEVAAMVATGLTNKAIAEQLNIAEVTVKKDAEPNIQKAGHYQPRCLVALHVPSSDELTYCKFFHTHSNKLTNTRNQQTISANLLAYFWFFVKC